MELIEGDDRPEWPITRYGRTRKARQRGVFDVAARVFDIAGVQQTLGESFARLTKTPAAQVDAANPPRRRVISRRR